MEVLFIDYVFVYSERWSARLIQLLSPCLCSMSNIYCRISRISSRCIRYVWNPHSSFDWTMWKLARRRLCRCHHQNLCQQQPHRLSWLRILRHHPRLPHPSASPARNRHMLIHRRRRRRMTFSPSWWLACSASPPGFGCLSVSAFWRWSRNSLPFRTHAPRRRQQHHHHQKMERLELMC